MQRIFQYGDIHPDMELNILGRYIERLPTCNGPLLGPSCSYWALLICYWQLVRPG